MEYVANKIAHLKRAGLVAGKNTGYHRVTGGACPDHNQPKEDAAKAAIVCAELARRGQSFGRPLST